MNAKPNPRGEPVVSYRTATLIPLALLSLAVFSASNPAYARPKPVASPTAAQTRHWTLSDNVLVNGKTLPAGNYTIVTENGEATFKHKKQIVATVPCAWKTLDTKMEFDGVVTDAENNLKEIDFDGTAKALLLK